MSASLSFCPLTCEGDASADLDSHSAAELMAEDEDAEQGSKEPPPVPKLDKALVNGA